MIDSKNIQPSIFLRLSFFLSFATLPRDDDQSSEPLSISVSVLLVALVVVAVDAVVAAAAVVGKAVFFVFCF